MLSRSSSSSKIARESAPSSPSSASNARTGRPSSLSMIKIATWATALRAGPSKTKMQFSRQPDMAIVRIRCANTLSRESELPIKNSKQKCPWIASLTDLSRDKISASASIQEPFMYALENSISSGWVIYVASCSITRRHSIIACQLMMLTSK